MLQFKIDLYFLKTFEQYHTFTTKRSTLFGRRIRVSVLQMKGLHRYDRSFIQCLFKKTTFFDENMVE